MKKASLDRRPIPAEIDPNPRQDVREKSLASGHEARSPLSAIRENCIDCSGGSRAEADRCNRTGCPLWPFRFGGNPWNRRQLSPDQRRAAARRLALAREAKQAKK